MRSYEPGVPVSEHCVDGVVHNAGGNEMEPRALTYEVKGGGEPIVLVPGGLTGWLSWIPHAERLSTSWKTIRVQPIHNELGSAGRPGDLSYNAETERESLRLTLDALGIERAHFAGWSGGGRALIEFAVAYPERVRSLTLVEPAAYWMLDQLGSPNPDVDRLNAFIHGLAGRAVTEDDLAEFLEHAGFVASKAEAPSHPNWERWLPHRMALSWQSEESDRSGRSIEELANIRCPVLLVKGSSTADWLKRVVDVLDERIPGASVIELEGDHACHIQSMDAFLAGFNKHLTSQSPNGSPA
jgi:pimeloyl-ACP methyl ester carboxylesterase